MIRLMTTLLASIALASLAMSAQAATWEDQSRRDKVDGPVAMFVSDADKHDMTLPYEGNSVSLIMRGIKGKRELFVSFGRYLCNNPRAPSTFAWVVNNGKVNEATTGVLSSADSTTVFLQGKTLDAFAKDLAEATVLDLRFSDFCGNVINAKWTFPAPGFSERWKAITGKP